MNKRTFAPIVLGLIMTTALSSCGEVSGWFLSEGSSMGVPTLFVMNDDEVNSENPTAGHLSLVKDNKEKLLLSGLNLKLFGDYQKGSNVDTFTIKNAGATYTNSIRANFPTSFKDSEGRDFDYTSITFKTIVGDAESYDLSSLEILINYNLDITIEFDYTSDSNETKLFSYTIVAADIRH